MNVTVYCGSSDGKQNAYREAALELADWIIRKDASLVYGGAKIGLMGLVADRVLEAGGRVIGIMPTFLQTREIGHQSLTELYIVNDMHERKKKLMDLGDILIALPGGPGTLEEISEAISWARIDQIKQPCFLYNKAGYYDSLEVFFDKMVDEGFLNRSERKSIHFIKRIEELDRWL